MAGRRPFQPSDEQRATVQICVANGLTQEQIAQALRIDRTTLRKHFAKELEEGFNRAYAVVISKLWANIQSGDRASIFFWLKTRARWQEVHRHELTGADGEPIRALNTLIPADLTNYSDDELAKLYAEATTASAGDNRKSRR